MHFPMKTDEESEQIFMTDEQQIRMIQREILGWEKVMRGIKKRILHGS